MIENTPLPHSSYPPTRDWRAFFAIVVGAVILAIPLARIPFWGHDWLTVFATQPNGIMPQFPNPSYPPWVLQIVLRPLTELPPFTGLAMINGFTLASVTLLAFRYARYTFPESRLTAVGAVIFAMLSPLPWMVMWLGQVEMLVLLGLVTLPIGIPVLLGKLHTGVWAVLNSRRDIFWTAVWGIVSIVLWGLWPIQLLTTLSPIPA
jgi:hypothetical protein